MSTQVSESTSAEHATQASDETAASVPPAASPRPREIGGRDGPEPTRYGDWERNGRCVDF